ncbi:MAG: glycosyltransferase [Acidimicrobiia bacterium]|nr:glycosyltransferase [Acidimicrobiia bacterium]
MTAGVRWVTAEVPDRNGGGGNQRQAYLLEALADITPVDLFVAGAVEDEAVRAAARRIVEIDAGPRPLPTRRIERRGWAAATTWAAGLPLDVAAYAPVRDAFARSLQGDRARHETTIVHHGVLAPLLAGPRFDDSRWVLHLFHAAGDRADQLAAHTDSALKRALLRRDGANARRIEQHAIDRADALVVATPQDALRLGRPSTPTHVVDQGIDLERFRPAPLPTEPVVLFSGSLDYDPNVDGITWFVASIWPLVRRRVPTAELLVVGRNPVASVSELADVDGVSVHADVPSMGPWLARSRVSIAPLRVGTGVRVKALEALAAGVPVVGTATALEGIELDATHASVAEDVAGFAASVVALLEDDALASSQRTAGRAFVEERHSWQASARQLAAALL